MRGLRGRSIAMGLVVSNSLAVADPASVDADANAVGTSPPAAAPPLVSTGRPRTRVARAEQDRSPNVALALSLVPTLAGVALVAGGIVVANVVPACGDVPSGETCRDTAWELGLGIALAGGVALLIGPTVGHYYSGTTWNGGLKVRLVGLGVAAIGTSIMFTSDLSSGGFELGGMIGTVGLLTFIVGTGIEISTAPGAARDSAARLTVAPLQTPAGAAPGVLVHGAF